MIDIPAYKRAVQWLHRSVAEQDSYPDTHLRCLSLSHVVEVTYNVTERTLREALVQVSDDDLIPGLSSRELMRFAADEGLTLSSPQAWLQYGLAIEKSNESLGEDFDKSILPLLPQYMRELEAFATRLEGRLAQNA